MPKRTQQGPLKIPQVGERVKADQVRPHDPFEQFLAVRQTAEQFLWRDRRVQKEADPQFRPHRPQHRRQQHQVVIMHPHDIAAPTQFPSTFWAKAAFTAI